ncbi:MAG: zinc-ribbon domain-containing protein [Desulfobacteraceae bacterium]|nr:zinc-ribbon domain-containing protein [Desulfobacteraceae bacterium]
MIVRCEACGANYQIDPSKIKSDSIKTRCRACGHVIIVHKPETQSTESPSGLQPAQEESAAEPLGELEPAEEKPRAESAYSEPKAKKRGISLRAKIFILFFFIPILLFACAGYFYLIQMDKLSGLMTKGTSEGMTELAQKVVKNKGITVANQVKLYLEAHPDLEEGDLYFNQEFKDIAVQKVGETGYTVLNAAPTEEEPWHIVVHPREDLIGAPIVEKIKAKLNEKNYRRFKKLHDEALETNEVSTGYYRFLDDKEKFQAMVPVEGTNYWTIATTYLDEFTQPVNQMEAKAARIGTNFRNIVLLIVIGAIVLLGLIVSFYGTVLIRRLRKLTAVAEQISVGEMDAEVPITSRDETGDLAEAIQRMQDSIRLSIERLRRRRRR